MNSAHVLLPKRYTGHVLTSLATLRLLVQCGASKGGDRLSII